MIKCQSLNLVGYRNFIKMHLIKYILRIDKMIKNIRSQLTSKGFILFIMLTCGISQISASEEALGSAIDCSTVKVNYTDNPEWTREERLKAMDKAFFESVNRFELCNLSNQSNAMSASENGLARSSSSGNANGTGSSSSESAIMKGTEKEADAESTSTPNDPSQTKKANSESAEKSGVSSSAKNGTTPKDIPGANNDDVIAAQIRLAAEIEQDPVKKKKLWNEYRKYKGLPTQ